MQQPDANSHRDDEAIFDGASMELRLVIVTELLKSDPSLPSALTQGQLAEVLGVHRSTIARHEREIRAKLGAASARWNRVNSAGGTPPDKTTTRPTK